MKPLIFLLFIGVALTVINAQEPLPCDCVFSGNPPTTTDTPEQRASVCSAGQAQLSCFKTCENATQTDLDGISSLLDQFGCSGGAGSNFISLLFILFGILVANIFK